uniref:Uncharacterized protein n=1 Tax=Plectus sambesii TaxID=2011161 RepID=A0A914VQ63_9BILA
DAMDGDGYPRSVANNDYQGYGTVDGGDGGYQASAFNQPDFKYQQDFPQPEYPAGQRPRDEKTFQVRDDPLNPRW